MPFGTGPPVPMTAVPLDGESGRQGDAALDAHAFDPWQANQDAAALLAGSGLDGLGVFEIHGLGIEAVSIAGIPEPRQVGLHMQIVNAGGQAGHAELPPIVGFGASAPLQLAARAADRDGDIGPLHREAIPIFHAAGNRRLRH